MNEKEPLYCSFCCKPNNLVEHLIAGPMCFICDECVVFCNNILAERAQKSRAILPGDIGIAVTWRATS